ncbi:MAG: response regulator [Myxococcales bacterium]|nr:MAG: response regulator [Myxococcales bacterium]
MPSPERAYTTSHEGSRVAGGSSLLGTRGHVLVVDDDSDVRDAVSAALEDGGYAVTLAHNGADALIKLSQMSLPSLILLDLAMPQLDGPDFLREMLHDPTYSHIPVVVVSGTALGREAAVTMGADDFLKKPLSPGELLRAIERALCDWDDEALAPTERQPTARERANRLG